MFAMTDMLKFKITAIIVGVLLVALFGVVTYYKTQVWALESTVSSQRTQIGELETSVASFDAANKMLESSIQEQNLKIDTLLRKSSEASSSAAKSIAAAQIETNKWKEKYKNVLFAPPPPASDECADLSLAVDAYLKLRAEGGL